MHSSLSLSMHMLCQSICQSMKWWMFVMSLIPVQTTATQPQPCAKQLDVSQQL